MLPILAKFKVESFLIKQNLITKKQLVIALDEHEKTGDDLSLILIRRRFLKEEIFKEMLSKNMDIPYIKIDPLELSSDITEYLPESFARNIKMIAFRMDKEKVFIALSRLLTDNEYEDILKLYHPKKIIFHFSSNNDINNTINEYYGLSKSIERALKDVGNLDAISKGNAANITSILEKELPIINLIDLIIHKAISQRASDIHIEPKRKEIHIRLRIDGVLHTVRKLPRELFFAVVARIKVMAGLDISEKRRPQDGRIRVEHEDHAVEIRVAIVPTLFGEKVVLRLLDPENLNKSITDLGLNKKEDKWYKQIINHTHGIILITGPTGSGKTTTLYATLNHVKSPTVNIITIEDPVELINEDFNQININHVIGFDFSQALREVLRQDPDIIMVGEIRDRETAENAIRSALTGHLVFSTLHTNDAISSIDRMRDMGIPNYLISSTLLGVIAQRLVRKVCPYCKTYYTPKEHELKLLDIEGNPKDFIFTKGKGCKMCNNTGYLDREALFEIIPMDDNIIRMIEEGKPTLEMKEYISKKGYSLLRQAGVKKVVKGITTISEVLRVTSL
ncbi:Flp pilus assembly complex ATPase component TadA [bacterium]|nr:Flp pilus assembly complex ATPase component TadA [bacterium]